jgi:23S rRNA (uracil1939-C5)-methyltransferase
VNGLHSVDDAAIPPCPHFGVCGGCQLQDVAYFAQLERKAAKLRELLGGFALPELQLHASPPFAYRNRIRLTLREVAGLLRAGYVGTALAEEDEVDHSISRKSSFVPIAQCPIAAPLLWRATEAFLALASGSSADWLRTPDLVPDQLEIFATADESRMQLTLYLRAAMKNVPAKLGADFSAFCDALRVQIPELAGAGIALLPAAMKSRRTEQPRPGPAWGAPGLNYTVLLSDRTSGEHGTAQGELFLGYWVPRGAFFQVNRFLLPELVGLVAHIAVPASQEGALAWDLYAGVGLFSRALAQRFAVVTAVEIAEPAAAALAQTKIANLHAIKATTLDFLRTAVMQRDRPGLIVLDPPRMGLGEEVCTLLTRIAAPTLVYVSCSPLALAADLVILAAAGYSIGEMHLFDLFPQTAHIETVAVLRRS